MVDTIGIPTVFFTHSAADNQWPDLARLICSTDPDTASSCSRAVIDNPAISDWFFSHTSMFWVLQTTGTGLSGNIVAAPMCMA